MAAAADMGRSRNRKWNSSSNSKWAMVAGGILIQASSGSSYTFGTYSEALKRRLGYDQSTLDRISACKDIGANVGVLSGILYSYTTPWLVLLAGAAQNCAGYAFLWLTVAGKIKAKEEQVGFFMFLAAHAQTFFNTAVAVTAVRNFPSHRGTVVGIMKGFLGLSGAILLQIYYTVYHGNQTSYLFMLAWLPTLSSILLMFVIKVHPSVERGESKTLNLISTISVAAAAYLMVVIILEHSFTLNNGTHWAICIGIAIILLSPVIIVVKKQIDSTKDVSLKQPFLDTNIDHSPCQLADTNMTNESDTRAENIDPETSQKNSIMTADEVACSTDKDDISRGKIKTGEDFTPFQAMRTVDFWLLFLAMACGMGSGLATINNMSQVGSSFGYESEGINTLISLWSIWNFLGRFGAGYTSEFFLHSKGCARPFFIALALLIMGIGHLVIASGVPGSLYIGSVMIGICYGCQWSLMPATTSEIFGLAHFGTLFNVIAIASPIGSYFFSVKIVGYIYDNEADKQRNLTNAMTLVSPSAKVCHGVHCFRLSFCIMSGFSLLGFIIAMLLFQRTKAFYKASVYERIVIKSQVSERPEL